MNDDRQQLSRRQAALLDALLGGAACPEGIDPGRAAATAEALTHKRAAKAQALRPPGRPHVTVRLGAWLRRAFAYGRAVQGRGAGS